MGFRLIAIDLHQRRAPDARECGRRGDTQPKSQVNARSCCVLPCRRLSMQLGRVNYRRRAHTVVGPVDVVDATVVSQPNVEDEPTLR